MTGPLQILGRLGARIELREIAPGVTCATLGTHILRLHGLLVTLFLVDDVLIDSGPHHLGPLVHGWLANRPLRGIALTHHHEDHTGNAGSLARTSGAPAWLRLPHLARTEGTVDLRPYRRLYWGLPDGYDLSPLPDRLDTGGRVLEVVPTPGHCATHSAFLDPRTGLAFVGDLLLTLGVSPVLRWEDPVAHVASLRRLADHEPRTLLNGHALVLDDAPRRLRAKADRVESAIDRIRSLHREGRTPREILHLVFPRGARGNAALAAFTSGEYSRMRFVEAVLGLGPPLPPPR